VSAGPSKDKTQFSEWAWGLKVQFSYRLQMVSMWTHLCYCQIINGGALNACSQLFCGQSKWEYLDPEAEDRFMPIAPEVIFSLWIQVFPLWLHDHRNNWLHAFRAPPLISMRIYMWSNHMFIQMVILMDTCSLFPPLTGVSLLCEFRDR